MIPRCQIFRDKSRLITGKSNIPYCAEEQRWSRSGAKFVMNPPLRRVREKMQNLSNIFDPSEMAGNNRSTFSSPTPWWKKAITPRSPGHQGLVLGTSTRAGESSIVAARLPECCARSTPVHCLSRSPVSWDSSWLRSLTWHKSK